MRQFPNRIRAVSLRHMRPVGRTARHRAGTADLRPEAEAEGRRLEENLVAEEVEGHPGVAEEAPNPEVGEEGVHPAAVAPNPGVVVHQEVGEVAVHPAEEAPNPAVAAGAFEARPKATPAVGTVLKVDCPWAVVRLP